MATVRENLIAAKALIDTPEKYEALRNPYRTSAFEAIREVTKPNIDVDGYQVVVALRDCLPAGEKSAALFCRKSPHADIIALFNRAIAAQDGE